MRGSRHGLVARRVRGFLAIALLAGVAPILVPSPAGAVVVGAPSNATARTGNEDESAVAVNPNNTQQIAVMSNGIAGDAGLPLSFSSNGGQTWTRTVFATGAGGDGRPTACCDPTLSWDEHGNLFVGYLQRNPRTIELYVTNDLGANFTNLGPVDTGAAGSLDQPTVVAGENSVWVTWRDDSGGIAARGRSVTGPLTFGAWGPEQDVSTAGNYGDVAIGPNGEVMVVYQDQAGGQGPTNIIVHTDADGLGAGGFGAGVTVTSSNVGGFDFLPAQPSRSVDAEAGLAWDRTGGARNGRVYLVYTDETPNESNNTDIFVRFSDNNGATWSAATRVNNDAGTNSQMLPKIALDQTSGVVGVSFYDARGDTGGGPSATDLDGTANNDVTLFASWSTDGGATWAANVAVADAPTNGYAMNGGQQLGDFTGLAFHGGVMYPSWADSSNSTGDNPDGTRVSLDVYVAAIQPLVNPSVDLALAKACSPGPVAPSSTVTCTLTVTGNGNTDAQAVVVTDNLPAGLTVAATPAPGGGGFTCSILAAGSQLSCTKPSQPNGTSSVITYTVLVGDQVGPGVTLENNASVTSATPDPTPGNDTSSASIVTVSCTIDASAGNGLGQILGTPGDDVICGGPAAEYIAALGGDDVVFGGGGNDRIAGGEGNDVLLGGPGNDQLAGGTGNDRLFGQADNDQAAGGDGTDTCDAEAELACEV
jgi:uncharacterized repeat protein (TIGR01451 family)